MKLGVRSGELGAPTKWGLGAWGGRSGELGGASALLRVPRLVATGV